MDTLRPVELLVDEVRREAQRIHERRSHKHVERLEVYVEDLLQQPLSWYWRQDLAGYLAMSETDGYRLRAECVPVLEGWIEAQARQLGRLPAEQLAAGSSMMKLSSDQTRDEVAVEETDGRAPLRPTVPAASIAAGVSSPESRNATSPGYKIETETPTPSAGRGDQTKFAEEAEEIVSRITGIPRNLRGPHEQRIPGSGPGGFRVLDLKVRGPEGSVRLRGTVVEVKASRGSKFGDLSGLSRQQIEDAIAYTWQLRRRAKIVRDPAIGSLLSGAHVEVFSDLPAPTRGAFAEYIRDGILSWKQIPRSATAATSEGAVQSAIRGSRALVGRPTPGLASSVALGLLASIAADSVSFQYYEYSAEALGDLLRQIDEDNSADEREWRHIEARLKEISDMKLSFVERVLEFASLNEHSLLREQGSALYSLALDLAERHGYKNVRTWGDVLDGSPGHFEKK